MKNKILKYIFTALAGIIAYLVYLVFRGTLVVPQILHVGSFPIRYFGIILALAVATAYMLAIKRAVEYKINRNEAEDIIFWTIVGGFIFARAYHVLSSLPYYLRHPTDMLMVWHGGLSIIGSLFGGLISLYLISKQRRQSFMNLLDWLAPSMVLGQIVGRFADLFNYELFGYPTNLPWKMFVPEAFRPEIFSGSIFFHPLFLYEALGNALILWILLKKVKPKKPGKTFFSYLIFYGVLRFLLEFLRIDSVLINGLRLNALVSLLFVLTGLIGLYKEKWSFEK